MNAKKAVSHGRSTNKTRPDEIEAVILDKAAILLQRLRSQGRLAHDQPLVRIDYRDQARNAPFRYDSAQGILHRRECAAIPADSQSVLYAVWQIEDRDRKHACKKCNPTPHQNGNQTLTTTDVVFGLLSIIDQFGTILFERGKEFRQTARGKDLERSLGGILEDINDANKQGLGLITSSLDTIVRVINEYNAQEERKNGGGGAAKNKVRSNSKINAR